MGDILPFRKNEEAAPRADPEIQAAVQEMVTLHVAALAEVQQCLRLSMPDILVEGEVRDARAA